MAITRFDKFTPRDYNMEWYAPKEFMPNFEAWSELLSTQQSKYDQAILASQKLPKHLQHRTDLAGEYKQKVTSGIDDISKTYMEKGLTEGNRKMRDFGLAYSQDWQPGGLAYELEQEYTDYANAQAQIDKYYKDNKAEHSVNRRFSLDCKLYSEIACSVIGPYLPSIFPLYNPAFCNSNCTFFNVLGNLELYI